MRLLNAAMVNGYSIVTYQRPMKAQDEFDRDILPNGTQPVIWGIGPLNSRNEVSYHSLTNKGRPMYTIVIFIYKQTQYHIVTVVNPIFSIFALKIWGASLMQGKILGKIKI